MPSLRWDKLKYEGEEEGRRRRRTRRRRRRRRKGRPRLMGVKLVSEVDFALWVLSWCLKSTLFQ